MKKYATTLFARHLAACLLLLSIGCHSAYLSTQKNERLTRQIIHQYLSLSSSGDRPVIVSEQIRYRLDYIRPGLFDNTDTLYQHLKMPAWDKLYFQYYIPDSLSDKVALGDFDPVKFDSSALYLAFSPLLPLKEKNCYLLQVYFTSRVTDEEFVYFWTFRQFEKYRIRRRKIELIIPSMNFEGPYDFK